MVGGFWPVLTWVLLTLLILMWVPFIAVASTPPRPMTKALQGVEINRSTQGAPNFLSVLPVREAHSEPPAFPTPPFRCRRSQRAEELPMANLRGGSIHFDPSLSLVPLFTPRPLHPSLEPREHALLVTGAMASRSRRDRGGSPERHRCHLHGAVRASSQGSKGCRWFPAIRFLSFLAF